MNLLEVKNIEMRYHSLIGETKALNNITFNVKEQEFISILGPSGCGKSTLLNILSGLIEPSSGCILFRGEQLKDNLGKIGYMFQKDHLFSWLTVWDNVTLGLRIKKTVTKENLQKVDELLEEYDLSKFKNHYPKELSGGMKQRVALIRTLALNPEVLFLDEPFSALDYQTRLKVCDDVHNIITKEKKTSIMVTHDIGEAISMSSRIILLSKRPGEIKLDIPVNFNKSNATPLEKRNEPEFQDYFNLLWKGLDA